MPIPFNQKALPEHLGYFTVSGSFLNVLTQVPSHGSFSESGIRKNWVPNPLPASTTGWTAATGMRNLVDGWYGGTLSVGETFTPPYIFTDSSERSYVAGDKVTFSVEYVSDDLGSSSHITVLPHKRTGNVYYSGGAQVTRSAVKGQLERVVLQWTVTESIPAGELELAILPSDALGNFISQTTGFHLRARHAFIEEGHTMGVYFDGSSTSTPYVKYVWDGAVNNSPSTATASSVVYPGRIQLLPIAGTVVFKPTITSPITDNSTGLTLVPTTITAHIDPDGRVIVPGDGKSSVPEVYDPDIKLLAPNQDLLSNSDWSWDIEVIPADGAYWQGFKMNIGSEARPGDMIKLNESLVVDRDVSLRPERVFVVGSVDPPYPFGFDPERDSLLIVPELTYWRVTT